MKESTIAATEETAANKRKNNYDDNKITLFVPVTYSKKYIDGVCIKKMKAFGIFEDRTDAECAICSYNGHFDMIFGVFMIKLVVDKREIDHIYELVIVLKTDEFPRIFTYRATERGKIKDIEEKTRGLVKSATSDIEYLLKLQMIDEWGESVYDDIKLDLHLPKYHIIGFYDYVTRSEGKFVPKSPEEESMPKSSEGEYIPGSPEEKFEPKLKKRKLDLE